jgi:hypothetical protein
MRGLAMLLCAAVILCGAAPAPAMRRGHVDVAVVADEGGELAMIPFKEYGQGGSRIVKKYLEAKKGANYSLVIRNRSQDRIAVVVAVDGRNIISGKQSNLTNKEAMYIIDPFGSTRLEGWRTDQNTVHRFYFTEVQDSYAVRTFGDTSAMGVIAVAVYREKGQPVHLKEQPVESGKARPPVAGAPGRAESRDAGTGFGEEAHSPTIRVEFDPERRPVEKVLIKYEWREALCRKGIIKCPPDGGMDGRNRLWDEGGEYAPHPPGYPRR